MLPRTAELRRAPRRVLVNAATNDVTPTTSAPMPVAMIAARVSFNPAIKVLTPAAAFLKPLMAPPVILSRTVNCEDDCPASFNESESPSTSVFAWSTPVTFTLIS